MPVGKNSELSISAGASVTIGVHPSGGTIFAGSDLQAPVTVPNGTAYSSITLEALLKAGLAGTQGNVGFGFEVGTALRYAYFHPFNIAGSSETVGGAIKTMLSAAVFPADTDDLSRLPVGAFASLAGEGELSFNVQASLSSTTNLLATPGLPIVGTVALVQAASVTVAAKWTASGEFELRVSKPSATEVRLSFYRRRGRSLTVSATALAGVSAEFRGRDLLAALMQAISSNPEADLLTLVNAGLDDESIEAIQQAVAASIDRSLTLSAQFQLSALREDEALFSYDIDLSRLDRAGKAAVADAMHGRLAAIGQAADAAGGPIRLIASAAKQLRERKTSWRINVLGIVNVASFVELVREGTVTFDPVSGMLTAADKVSARRIRIKEKPFESDTEKLQQGALRVVDGHGGLSREPGAWVESVVDRRSHLPRAARAHEAERPRGSLPRADCARIVRRAGTRREAGDRSGVRPLHVRHREPLRVRPRATRCFSTRPASRTGPSATSGSRGRHCWP